MNIKEFSILVKDNIEKTFGKNYSVSITEVKKNNGVILNGITITKIGNNLAPTIYLEKFFEKYTNGENIENILTDIMNVYEQSDKDKDISIDDVKYWDIVKDYIYPILGGKIEWNENMDEYVSSEICDLKVFYVIDLSEMGIFDNSTIRVKESLFENWEVSYLKLHNTAIQNLISKKEVSFKSMFDTLKELVNSENDIEIPIEEMPLFVVSNKAKYYGANIVFNKIIMKQIRSKLGSDLVLIPSSVHEWIIMRESEDIDIENINEMIESVNLSQVDRNDWLSDHVYYFRDNGLEM